MLHALIKISSIFILVSVATGQVFAQLPNQRLLAAAEIRTSTMKSFCTSKPKIDIRVIEMMAAKIKVNPRTISLERAEFVTEEDRNLKVPISKCVGVFYTQNGPLSCNVEFSKDGVIQKACDVAVSFEIYSETLIPSIPLTQTEAYDRQGNKVDGWASSNPYMNKGNSTATPLAPIR